MKSRHPVRWVPRTCAWGGPRQGEPGSNLLRTLSQVPQVRGGSGPSVLTEANWGCPPGSIAFGRLGYWALGFTRTQTLVRQHRPTSLLVPLMGDGALVLIQAVNPLANDQQPCAWEPQTRPAIPMQSWPGPCPRAWLGARALRGWDRSSRCAECQFLL